MDNYKDITKEGVGGLKSIRQQMNAQQKEKEAEYQKLLQAKYDRLKSSYKGNAASKKDLIGSSRQYSYSESDIGLRAGDYGQSSYDEGMRESDLSNIQNYRADEQSWITKIGAGVAKAGVLAGTSFIDGTVGLVFGATKAAQEGRWSALWDNDVSNAMSSLTKESEKIFANYYTEDEQANPLALRNIASANFLGDKLIKNLGFMIGAAYSGRAWQAPMRLLQTIGKASQVAKGLSAVRNYTNATDSIITYLGAGLAALNEGRIEANNNGGDWLETNMAPLRDNHNATIQFITDNYTGAERERLLAQEDADFMDKSNKAQEMAAVMGNADLLFNLPILMASNIIGLGRFFGRGFKTARKTSGGVEKTLLGDVRNVMKGTEKFAADRSKTGRAWAGAKAVLSEGTEEISQSAASRAAGNGAQQELDSYIKAPLDYDTNKEQINWIKAIAQGVGETLKDEGAWEEFLVGSLSGAIGMPRFRGFKGKNGKWQSPITFDSGLYREWVDYNKAWDRENQVADYLNKRVQDPDFKNRYQALLRHRYYQKNKEKALEDNDKFSYENSDFSQLIGDIHMFDAAGLMSDYEALIDSFFDTSEENLQSIVKNSIDKETGKGPFIDANGNSMADTEEGRKKMVEELNKKKEALKQTINDYREIKDNILFQNPDATSPEKDEQLRELIWLEATARNLNRRGVEMAGNVKDILPKIIRQYKDVLRSLEARQKEGEKLSKESEEDNEDEAALKHLMQKVNEGTKTTVEGYKKTLSIIESLLTADSTSLYAILGDPKNEHVIKFLSNQIDKISNAEMSESAKEVLKTQLQDIKRAMEMQDKYNAKLKEYLSNPEKQDEAHNNTKEEEVKDNKTKKAKESAKEVKDTEIPDLVAQWESGDFDDSRLAELEEAGETEAVERAKTSRDINEAKQQLRERIDKSEMSPSQKKAAHQMLDKSSQSAESIEELLDTNGEAFFNTEGTLELSEEEQAELQAIMANDKEEGQQALAKKMQENDEEARAELQAIFDEWEQNKKDLEALKTDDDEIAGAMGSSKEELEAAMEERKKEGETGADPAGKVPPIQPVAESTKNERTIETESDGKPNSSQDVVTTEPTSEDDVQQEQNGPSEKQSLPKSNGGQPLYWKSNTTQEITAQGEEKLGLSVGHHKKYHETPLDPNPEKHEIIWNYLYTNGAFTRMNQGMVHEGSKVRIGFDKKLNEQVGANVPLLYIEDPENKGHWLLVGDMISALDSYHEVFPNYNSFLTRLGDFLNKSSDEQGITPIELTVKSVLQGRPNYSKASERHTLNEIADGRKFKLAIATKNPKVVIVDSKKIKNPRTDTEKNVNAPLTQTPGQPFILVGDAHNGYMCVPIRLPKFDVAKAKDSALGRHILKIAQDLNRLDELSINEITLLKNDLQSVFNFEHLWIHKSAETGNWVITYKTPNMPKTKYLTYNNDARNVQGEIDIANRVLTQFTRDGIGYQIDMYKMNSNEKIEGKSYNEAIGELANTNLEIGGLELINNFPIFNFQDADGKNVTATTPKGNHTASDPVAFQKSEEVITTLEKQKIDRPTPTNNVYIINGISYERVHTVMGSNSRTEMTSQGRLNGERAKAAGTEVDSIVRQFFEISDEDYARDSKGAIARITYNKNIVSKKAFDEIIPQLQKLRKYFNTANRYRKFEKVYANNIVVSSDFNGTKVAGEIDIVTIDDKGNFRIYDMKTSKNSFGAESYDNPKPYQIRSDREEHSRQLNFYADMLEKEYGVKVLELNIIPINVRFNNGNNAILHSVDPVVTTNVLPFIPLKRSATSTQEAIEAYRENQKPKVPSYSGTLVPEANNVPTRDWNSIEKDAIVRTKEGKEVLKLNPYVQTTLQLAQKYGLIPSNINFIKSEGSSEVWISKDHYTTAVVMLNKRGLDNPSKVANLEIKDGKLVNAPKIGENSNNDAKELLDLLSRSLDKEENKANRVNYHLAPGTNRLNLSDREVIIGDNFNTKNGVRILLTETEFNYIRKLLAIAGNNKEKQKEALSNIENYILTNVAYRVIRELKLGITTNIKKASETFDGKSPQSGQRDKTIYDAPQEVQDAINSIKYTSDEDLQAQFPQLSKEQINLLGEYLVNSTAPWLEEALEIYAIISKPKAEPSTPEAQSLARQNTLDSLGDNSSFTDYEENRDIVEMLTDSQLEALQNMKKGPKTKRIWQGFINMIDRSKPLNQKEIREAFDTALNTKFSTVEESDANKPRWDEKSRKKELRRIAKMLPQLSPADRIRLVSKIEEIAGKDNPEAWGKYVNGIITLYENAITGTGYHEAFHYVIDGLLDDSEKDDLFKIAREEFGSSHTLSELEESLADGFKEYSLLRDDASIGQRLKNFFKDLWIDIKHFFGAKDNLNAIYSRIYRGKYADRQESFKDKMSLRQDMQDFLNNFGITIKDVKDFGGEIKLFDALNRTINIRTVDDITDGVGEAVAFMMQWDPKIREIISVLKTGSKSALVKYNFHKPFRLEISDYLYKYKTNKQQYIQYLGQEISYALRRMYNLEVPTEKDATMWGVISRFFSKMNPITNFKVRTIRRRIAPIINNIITNNPKGIVPNYTRPGETREASLLSVERAFRENPYEADIIKYLGNNGILLGGSTSIALAGTLYRQDENPLHDIDFQAGNKSKREIEELLKAKFPAIKLTNTIKDKKKDSTTYTYLVLDRPFVERRELENIGVESIFDAVTGEKLGTRSGSNLILKEGVKGKMLDFFTGSEAFGAEYEAISYNINGTSYKIADYRGAMAAKVDWKREKDIWDYNRFIPNTFTNTSAEEQRIAKNKINDSTGNTDISKIINADGSINFDELEKITDTYFKNADESLFKKGRKTLRERKEHHDGETNTLEHLQNVYKSALNSDIRSDLKPQLLLAAALHDLAKPFHGGQQHGFQSVEVINKIFKGNISNLVKFAVRHHMMTLNEEDIFSQEDADRIIQDAIDNNINVQDAIEVLLALNIADITRNRDLSTLDQYAKIPLKDVINKEIPEKRAMLERAADNISSFDKNKSNIKYSRVKDSTSHLSDQEILDELKSLGITFDNNLVEDLYKNLNLKNPYHQVFKQMIDILKANNMPINISTDFNLKAPDGGSPIALAYPNKFKQAKITFNPRTLLKAMRDLGYSEEQYKRATMQWLTHELVHTTTMDLLFNEDSTLLKEFGLDEQKIKFNEEINKLYTSLKKVIGDEGWYGMTDPREFVSELFSNRDFQLRLAQIPIENNKEQSVFDKFVNLITDMFNEMFKSLGVDISNTALEQALSISQEYFDHVIKGQLNNQPLELKAPDDLFTDRDNSMYDNIAYPDELVAPMMIPESDTAFMTDYDTVAERAKNPHNALYHKIIGLNDRLKNLKYSKTMSVEEKRELGKKLVEQLNKNYGLSHNGVNLFTWSNYKVQITPKEKFLKVKRVTHRPTVVKTSKPSESEAIRGLDFDRLEPDVQIKVLHTSIRGHRITRELWNKLSNRQRDKVLYCLDVSV